MNDQRTSYTLASRVLLAAIGCFVLIRVALFPWAKNYVADAVLRASLARTWAEHPHVIRHAAEIYVVGPLHIYLSGLGVLLFGADVGARLPSLVAGCALAWPLARLARRFAGARKPWAGTVAVLAVAICALHVQSSTAAGSEALMLTPLLWATERALVAIATGAIAPSIMAGVLLSCACAVRYDAWLYAGALVVAAMLCVATRRRGNRHRSRRRWRAVATIAVLAAVFPVVWSVQNAVALGDAAWVQHTYRDFHVGMASRIRTVLGNRLYVAWALSFWPTRCAWILTPGVAWLAAWGAWSARRRADAVVTLFTALAPGAYLTFRAAVLSDFGLLDRFVLPAAILVAPFVGRGAMRAHAWFATTARRQAVGRAAVALSVLLALAIPGGCWARSHGRSDALAERLRTMSPRADLPPAVVAILARVTADPLAQQLRRRTLLVDADGTFAGGAIAYYAACAGLNEVYVSAPSARGTFAASPGCAVLFPEGEIGRSVHAAGSDRVVLDGVELMREEWHAGGAGGVNVGLYCGRR